MRRLGSGRGQSCTLQTPRSRKHILLTYFYISTFLLKVGEDGADEEVVDCQNELDPEQNPPNPEEEMAMKDEDLDDEDEMVREWKPEDGLQEGEVLDFDPSVYMTMHQLSLEVGWGFRG